MSSTWCHYKILYKGAQLYVSFTAATNALSASESRYFKPSWSAFRRVSGRGPDAWVIRPGSYFLLPFRQAFHREFPKDFTVFLTLRASEESEVGLTCAAIT